MSISYSPEQYHLLYKQSIRDPEKFWDEQAKKELDWLTPFKKSFVWNKPDYQWFAGGKLNITYNCLDRHIRDGRGQQIAYIYNNERNEESRITYQELLLLVNKAANALKGLGIQKGDRVVIYMPLMINQIVLMLACARLGAIHSVVYAGFSADALKVRILDTQAKIVCAATFTQKNGKQHDLLNVVRSAIKDVPCIEKVIVAQRSEERTKLQKDEIDLDQLLESSSGVFEPVAVESSTPLFILYTSGTTGTPKGIVHGHGGYNLFSHISMKYNFDLQPGQIHWTAADTGWVTGHSYIVYGLLSNGITGVIYEGSPVYPAPDRYWELVERYKIQSFYTAPTVIRLLMREGSDYTKKHDLSSLRVIGSVGEPINPAAWKWYSKYVGKNKAAIIDTWWQTETGGHMLVTAPGMKQKPGSAGLPFFGIEPCILNEEGNELGKSGVVGHLAIKRPWPGALLTVWNNKDRFSQYWSEFANKDYFYTGDVALRDEDGYYTVLGRADDVINVGGVRVCTAEVESALVAHDSVAEAAVIGISDEVRGEIIKAFVLLNPGIKMTDQLQSELKSWVRQKIGYIAEPAKIESVVKLPKTRSGKIMRRILKARQMGLHIGDTSTLEE